jgi:DNA polymerase-4
MDLRHERQAMRVILHVDLDAFFVAVEQVRDPSLRGRPVIVGGDPRGRGVVSTASYEARRFGIHSGMPLVTARRLCPYAVFLRGDFRPYTEVSRAFHALLGRYTPLVEPAGIDEAYLDLTGCEPVAGPPLDAAHQIRARVREDLSLAASVGVASGKTVAKIASDATKPDGLLEVPPGQGAAFLAPLPVRRLPGVGPRVEAALAAVGVDTLGQLASLPETRLRILFGRHGPRLAELAGGLDPLPVASLEAPPKSVSREGTFATDVSDAALLRAVLRSYCESVAADLRRRGLRARSFTLKLRYGDFTTITRRLTVDRPAHADDVLYRAAETLLEAALARDGRALRLIGFGASNLVEDAVQLPLQEAPWQRLERLDRAVDGVRLKYGRRCLQRGRTLFEPLLCVSWWDDGPRTGLSSQVGLH